MSAAMPRRPVRARTSARGAGRGTSAPCVVDCAEAGRAACASVLNAIDRGPTPDMGPRSPVAGDNYVNRWSPRRHEGHGEKSLLRALYASVVHELAVLRAGSKTAPTGLSMEEAS